MLRKILLIAWLVGAMVIHTTPMWASMGVKSDRLELDGEVLGEAVSEEEMDGKRGTYMGFYFSVLFEGFWDTLGYYNTSLMTGGTTPLGNTSSSSLPQGTQVNIQATVSGIEGTKGIFQITQVPGSGNIVTSNLIVNIQIIQVLGNSLPSILSLSR